MHNASYNTAFRTLAANYATTFEFESVKKEKDIKNRKEKKRGEEKKIYREKEEDSTLALSTLLKSRKGHVLLNARRRHTCPWSTK